jgi:hypothetical protein
MTIDMRDGRPALFRGPEIAFVDDKAGKPVLQMLQWVTMSDGRRLGLIVHHADGERAYAYDRQSHFGRLNKAFDVAVANNWSVVSMKDDWKRIFAFNWLC